MVFSSPIESSKCSIIPHVFYRPSSIRTSRLRTQSYQPPSVVEGFPLKGTSFSANLQKKPEYVDSACPLWSNFKNVLWMVVGRRSSGFQSLGQRPRRQSVVPKCRETFPIKDVRRPENYRLLLSYCTFRMVYLSVLWTFGWGCEIHSRPLPIRDQWIFTQWCICLCM
jgi:hypothetical protein